MTIKSAPCTTGGKCGLMKNGAAFLLVPLSISSISPALPSLAIAASERANNRTSKPRKVRSAAAAHPPLPAPKTAIFRMLMKLFFADQREVVTGQCRGAACCKLSRDSVVLQLVFVELDSQARFRRYDDISVGICKWLHDDIVLIIDPRDAALALSLRCRNRHHAAVGYYSGRR